MEERRLNLMRLLRDLIIMQQDGVNVEAAIRATVAEFNEIEKDLGHETKPPEYYLAM